LRSSFQRAIDEFFNSLIDGRTTQRFPSARTFQARSWQQGRPVAAFGGFQWTQSFF
jgi:hypothetical protein